MDLTIFNVLTLPTGSYWDLVLCGAFVILLAGVALYALAIPQGDWRWWGLAGLLGALVIIAQTVAAGTARALLLDGAALVAVVMVWIQNTPGAKKAAQTYLIFLVLAVVLMEAGAFLGGAGESAPAYPMNKIVAALLLLGFCLKLAIVPFYFWLPGLAEHAKPMTTALVVSIIDIAAFGELAHLRLEMPWIFNDYAALWLALALFSMYGGALLALAQKNIKRSLAYSTIDDMGYLLLGLLVGSQAGLSGAILAALSHSFFKVLLFGAVGLAENRGGHALTLDDRGLSTRYPVSAAVFILSALGMIGVPPFFGFIGRWRLYLTAVEYGGVWLVLVMACATALALLYYVRVIHRVWLGEAEQDAPADEPKLAAAVLVVLLVLMLAAGLFPGWLTGLIG